MTIMDCIYAKYEFDTLPNFEEMEVKGAVVVLGNLVKTEGTYDEEGNVLTEPVYSDKIAVDILYNANEEVIAELEPSRIYPKTPSHYIAGCEECYLRTVPETTA
jgi:hypothetical protein